MHYIRWKNGEEIVGLTEREMYKMLWEKTGETDPKTGLCFEPESYGKVPGEIEIGDPAELSEEELARMIGAARDNYGRLLAYAAAGIRDDIGREGISLTGRELPIGEIDERIDRLQKLREDLHSVLEEAERMRR